MAVLSRADEIGGGRVDAMFSARGIAARYRADPTVRGLCQNVVAVAGLAGADRPDAAAGRAHRARRAGPHRTRRPGDRAAVGRPVPAGGTRRRGHGRGTPAAAGALRAVRHPPVDLVDPPGCRRSRRARDGTGRPQRPARARAGAAHPVRRAPRRAQGPFGAAGGGRRAAHDDRAGHREGPLAREIDRILAGAHEFTELRLLSALRSGSVTLPNRDADDGERLLGDAGASPAARLGLAPDAPSQQVADAAYTALERWQRHTANPMLEPGDDRRLPRGRAQLRGNSRRPRHARLDRVLQVGAAAEQGVDSQVE